LATRDQRRQRRAQHEAAIRAALFHTLAEPGQSERIMNDLVAGDRKLLEAKTRAVLPALRGEDRETLARLLESRGVTDVARRKCRSHRATSRAAACQVLGDVGSSFAVLDLVPLLDDPRLAVRLAAARALGRLGQPAAVAPLLQLGSRPHPLPVDVAADAIQSIRGWPISLLQPCLSDPSERARSLATELLGRAHALDRVDDLIDLLECDPSAAVRARAARALGVIGSPGAIEPLIACLASGPPSAQAEAVFALGRLGAADAVPALHRALLGPSRGLSLAAATALSSISPDGVVALQEVADDERHPAGAVAREALAGPRAVSDVAGGRSPRRG
jgi:HEAT repeat protein